MSEATDPSSYTEVRVLICDDVDAMRVLLDVVVGLREGFRVVGQARDGNEAVSEAERLQPDVILLDLSMPHRSGLDALPEIKRVAPDAEVIVLSGFVASMIAADVLALGAARFVEKGADPELIIAAIEEVVANRISLVVDAGSLRGQPREQLEASGRLDG
jgi:two-component system invasion response regulator UvrY